MKIGSALLTAAALLAAGNAIGAMDDKKASEMMTKAGCNACHAVDKKLVGPSYQEVGKKYKGDAKAPAMLAEKVRKGGSGTWGQVPMPPNAADKISDGDLKELIAWILTKG